MTAMTAGLIDRVRAELTVAIGEMNNLLNELAPEVRDAIDLGHQQVDVDLDEALAADDEQQALAAIRNWRAFHLALVEGARQPNTLQPPTAR